MDSEIILMNIIVSGFLFGCIWILIIAPFILYPRKFYGAYSQLPFPKKPRPLSPPAAMKVHTKHHPGKS